MSSSLLPNEQDLLRTAHDLIARRAEQVSELRQRAGAFITDVKGVGYVFRFFLHFYPDSGLWVNARSGASGTLAPGDSLLDLFRQECGGRYQRGVGYPPFPSIPLGYEPAEQVADE